MAGDLDADCGMLVGQQMDEAVGQANMSAGEEPGAGSGNRGRLLRGHSL